nr:hypothetical protein [Fretibacterium sp.]
LMEGTAPGTALAKAFRTFRKWLTDIYCTVPYHFFRVIPVPLKIGTEKGTVAYWIHMYLYAFQSIRK